MDVISFKADLIHTLVHILHVFNSFNVNTVRHSFYSFFFSISVADAHLFIREHVAITWPMQ